LKSPSLSPGELVDGRYRVVRELGIGAFGSAYLVEHTQLRGLFVLKISSSAPGTDELALQRFRREAEVRSRITSPNVANLIECAQLPDGRPYLVTEWVDGLSVGQFIRERGPLPLVSALEVAEAVAHGLAAAHAVGVIHRDIKPENVILPGDAAEVHFNQAKLVDFGVHGELLGDSNSTQAGQVFGTPTYMSPEQLRGQSQTPAADIYGLGMLLYEMLYGRPAFTADNINTFILRVLQENVTFPPTPEVPAGVTAFMERCLSKNQEARPQSASLVIAELQGLKHTALGARAEATSMFTRLMAPAPSRPAIPASAPPAAGASMPQAVPAPYAAQRPSADLPFGPASPAAPSSLMAAGRYVLPAGIILLAMGVGLSVWVVSGHRISPEARGLLVGLLLIFGGIALGTFLHRWLGRRRSQIERETEQILQGAKTRVSLTESIALEVDALFRRCKQVDERIFAASMALMLQEYESAKESNNRQAALMNVVQITDKLTDRLCPWYVKHEKVVAIVGSAVGVISGAASAAESFLKILGRH
jgi:eukaryotic-like serine/threonine-protein kinase